MEYKVVQAYVERNNLEEQLNTLAKQGWYVKQIFLQVTKPSMSNGASHEYFTAIMERDNGN